MINNTEVRMCYNRNRLIAIPSIFSALWYCNIENILVSNKKLFLKRELNTLPFVTLEQFEHLQLQNIFKVRNVLIQ